ncbi:caspase recruitment domain-containing protein 14-like isoform X2 [Ostrea edulis]|uniref:caspase recruitment domain-containing protein 14-like isoform X2 n=1 Tax=Ostrea edulis TaxID=37623 RepID=UPI002096578D|nr:caspase recruitment domain-containing protein 14-like isoform X2 [Ostrea edulis]
MSDSENDIFEELIETKRYKIVKYINARVFYDKLRELKVLTMDDVEMIQSKITRRQQAAHFLDVLQTKGDNGVRKFLEILEWEYPHVYKEITNKDARDPPTDYLKHRESMYAAWLYKLPELAESLKNDYEHKKDLHQKIQEMKEVMKFAQENNTELERENQELQEKLKNFKNGKIELEQELGHCIREMSLSRDKCMAHMENSLEYQKEINILKDTLRDVRHDRDGLAKQIEHLSARFHQSKAETAEARRKSYSMNQLNTENFKPFDRQTSAQDIEITILKEKFDQEQEKCEELNQQLLHVTDELDHAQAQLRKTKSYCEKLCKEVEAKDEWLEEKRKRIDGYFKEIERLEEEKKRLDEERNKEQRKVKEEQENSRKLFSKVYQLENKLEDLRSENEKLKAQSNRASSGSSVAEDTTPSEKFPAALEEFYPDENEPLYRSNVEHYLKGTHVPQRDDSLKPVVGSLRMDLVEDQQQGMRYSRIPVQSLLKGTEKLSQPGILEQLEEEVSTRGASMSNTMSSDTSEDTDAELTGFNVHIRELPLKWRPTKSVPPSGQFDKQRTYKVTLPVLDEKIKIIGGNFSGIFITEVSKKLDSGICVGDQVVSVQLLRSDYSCVSKKEMRGLTLMEARTAFLFENQRDDEKELEITIKKTSPEEFENIKKWMDTQKSTGDFFYVRACASIKEKEAECLPVKKGDILRVTNTNHSKGDHKYWRVCLYNRQNGQWGKEGIIPADFRRLCTVDRRLAFRARSQFVRVLPMKAISKLPVVMYGAGNVIGAAQNLIVDDSTDFLCYNVDKGRDIDILRHCLNNGKHCMMRDALLKKLVDVYIIMVINTDNATPEILKSVFGVDHATEVKYRLPEDVLYETITVGNAGIKDRKSFLRVFYDGVQKGQERMCWFSSSQLDGSTMEQYQDYLGKESTDQHTRSQDSNNEVTPLYERSSSTPL